MDEYKVWLQMEKDYSQQRIDAIAHPSWFRDPNYVEHCDKMLVIIRDNLKRLEQS